MNASNTDTHRYTQIHTDTHRYTHIRAHLIRRALESIPGRNIHLSVHLSVHIDWPERIPARRTARSKPPAIHTARRIYKVRLVDLCVCVCVLFTCLDLCVCVCELFICIYPSCLFYWSLLGLSQCCPKEYIQYTHMHTYTSPRCCICVYHMYCLHIHIYNTYECNEAPAIYTARGIYKVGKFDRPHTHTLSLALSLSRSLALSGKSDRVHTCVLYVLLIYIYICNTHMYNEAPAIHTARQIYAWIVLSICTYNTYTYNAAPAIHTARRIYKVRLGNLIVYICGVFHILFIDIYITHIYIMRHQQSIPPDKSTRYVWEICLCTYVGLYVLFIYIYRMHICIMRHH